MSSPNQGLFHVWRICTCKEDRCPFCDWRLQQCTVCNASEGELLSYCPGHRLDPDARLACFDGNVKDFFREKRRLRKVST